MQADEEAEKRAASIKSARQAIATTTPGTIAMITPTPSGNNTDWVRTDDDVVPVTAEQPQQQPTRPVIVRQRRAS